MNLAQIMAMRKRRASTTTTTTTTTANGNDDDDDDDDDDENVHYDDNDAMDDYDECEVTGEEGSAALSHTTLSTFNGPSLITFDGDQTLYSDGANFESNPRLATYLYILLKHAIIGFVTIF